MPGATLKAGARKIMFDNFPGVFIISLAFVFFTAVVSWFIFRLPGSLNMDDINSRLASGELPGLSIIYTDFRPIGLILALLLYLIQPLLDFGFISYCFKTKRGFTTDFKDLFNGFLFLTKVISIFLISMVFIILWGMLFIIPGIVAAYRYRQAYYILLDDPNKGALQCISESSLLMNGRKVDLLILDISFLGWFFLDVLVYALIPLPFTIPFISIWLSPYLGFTRVGFYEDLIANTAV